MREFKVGDRVILDPNAESIGGQVSLLGSMKAYLGKEYAIRKIDDREGWKAIYFKEIGFGWHSNWCIQKVIKNVLGGRLL